MKQTSIYIPSLPLALLVSLQLCVALAFSSDQLLVKYELYSGRSSACPSTISYSQMTSNRPFMPATSMKAGGHACFGKGGKRVVEGSSILSHGLKLPSLLSNPSVSFYGGVETDTRVCGPWAFNASSISWFIVNNDSDDVVDDDTSITLQPGYVHVSYSHFSDLCVYRSKLETPNAESGSESNTESGSESNTESGFGSTTESGFGSTTESDFGSNGESDFGSNGESESGSKTDTNPEETAEDTENDSACFPEKALVMIEGRGSVEMKSVEIGDRVLSSANGKFSEVFAFSHQDPYAISTFVVIRTSSGRILPLSPGHLLYVQGVPMMAKEVRIGNYVMTAPGKRERIISVERRYMKGLYNPQTLDGNIVVNGVLATTWTSAVAPVTAVSLLSPMRWLFRISPAQVSSFAAGHLNFAIDRFRSLLRYRQELRY